MNRASLLLTFLSPVLLFSNVQADFQAGATVVDITPTKLPVLVNGGFLTRSLSKVNTPLSARALALSDGETTIALVVADSCMMPRKLLDEAKSLASKRTGIPTDRIMISATHTHTAPSCIGALGTDADPDYVKLLRLKLADAVAGAVRKLQPAQVGFAANDAAEFTALRRWILRPDRIANDPFGNPTVRANMHAGRNLDDVTGESGPEDPDLSMISIQSIAGEPIAVLANFSMHYYGDQGLSADYFGRFCEGLKQRIAPDSDFVGILSHGCSGDIWRRDYARPEQWDATQTIDDYTRAMLDLATTAHQGIEYRADALVAMGQRILPMKYRVPNKQLLQWAEQIIAEMGDRPPKSKEEVYAREQIILHERQKTEIVVQGIRIGDIGIATTPTETYAITGLKIKAASPLTHNMVIELANGGDGYVPPPEQHRLGGYNTWPARSAGLEVMAEPRIAEACIGLLEQVSGKTRREAVASRGPAADAIVNTKPTAWWRLDEFSGPHAIDSSRNGHDAIYESGVTYYLAGPDSDRFCGDAETNRSAMFAGGRLCGRLPTLGESYSVSLWLWNGMPIDAREISGWFFSRGHEHGLDRSADHLGIGGKGEHAGRLVFLSGGQPLLVGKTEIPRWTWQHVVLVRDRELVKVYLNGQLELAAQTEVACSKSLDRVFFGGRTDNDSNWEGRLDEIAVFDRAIGSDEIAALAPPKNMDALQSIEATRGGRHWVDAETQAPKSPAESQRCFEIEPGCEVQLFAAEPLVKDPVAIAFDSRGRMFVAEYGDYPTGAPDGEPPLSRIVMLEDTNDDGRADRRHIFADNVRFAHNLMAFRNGFLVGTQTEITYLEDTDHDDRADVRHVLFDGFQPAHPQMQIGNPRWGLDNWIYFNYGAPGKSGQIRCGEYWQTLLPDSKLPKEVDMKRGEFRFHPVTGEFGPASGLGQYGNTIDNWGRRFFARNRNPIVAEAFPWDVWRRNRFALIPTAEYDVAPAGNLAYVYPLVEMKSNYLSHAGTHTAACGTTAYRGDLFDSPFQKSVFVCEPIGHLVTRTMIARDRNQVTLNATRAAGPKKDFLASTDAWFRPASLATGPGGALYLADMYRLWVEHPKFLPDDVAGRLDWRAGDNRGRIWRIVPKNTAPAKFSATDDPVKLLSDPSGWRRQLGQRLLVERQDRSVIPSLTKLLTDGSSGESRLHALWTLDGLQALSLDHLQAAIADREPFVRSAGIKLAAGRLAEQPELLERLKSSVEDQHAEVRFQLVIALGASNDRRATQMLIALALQDADKEWVPEAIFTSSESRSAAVLSSLIASDRFTRVHSNQRERLIRGLAGIVGARGDESEIAALLSKPNPREVRGAWWETAMVAGFADGLSRQRGSTGRMSLASLLADPPERLLLASNRVRDLLHHSRTVALDERQAMSDRLAAIELLGYSTPDILGDSITALLSDNQHAAIQLAALRTLRQSKHRDTAAMILDNWSSLRSQARSLAMNILLSRSENTRQLLGAMVAGNVSPAGVSIDARVRLLRHSDAEIRELAESQLGGAVSSDRRNVADRYRAALTIRGSSKAGAEVFRRTCMNCHQVDSRGHSVGPDLSDVRNRSEEALLYDILDPNRKVDPQYTSYSVVTVDGRVFNGLMTTETEDAVILRQTQGKEQVIAREDIERLVASDQSLMPEGVEKEISVRQMADLLAFLKSRRLYAYDDGAIGSHDNKEPE